MMISKYIKSSIKKSMNGKIFPLMIAWILIGLHSCAKFDPVPEPDPDPAPEKETNYTFISSENMLTSGVNFVNESLEINSNTVLNIDLAAPVEIDPIHKNILKRIVAIDALGDGQTVSDIYFGEEYVFVSYRNPEQKYRGTVDVYAIKSTWDIKRKARFSFDSTDIKAVCHVSGRLLLACASESKPMFIEQIAYDPSTNNEPVFKGISDVPASNLCGIAASENKIFVLADKGTPGVYIYDTETMKQDKFVSLQNPVSMSFISGSNNVLALQNTSPVSIVKITSSGQIIDNMSPGITNLGQNTGITAKNRIYVRSDNQMQTFSNNDSKKQSFSWQEETPGTLNSFVNGKNVAVMKDWLVMLGNNGKGIRLCGLRNRLEADVTSIYNVKNSGESLSILDANDNLAFIAEQNGKLHILRRVSNGFPEIPVYEQNMEQLNNAVKTVLFYGNNFAKYPNLIETEINQPILTVKTNAKTKLYVSIVFQDATTTNSIGYYTFNSSNLPDEASKLSKNILFPNTLTAYETGNTVILCDADGNAVEFEAGQEIGFYLIQQGWNSNANNGYGGIKTDQPTMYSHLRYNLNNYQQQILFRLEGQNPIFIGFEDKWQNESPSWDGDMNDIVIAISDNMDNQPITKIDMTGIPPPTEVEDPTTAP